MAVILFIPLPGYNVVKQAIFIHYVKLKYHHLYFNIKFTHLV